MKKFHHLDVPHQWEEYWTKYPHGYSIFEALSSWVTQVDDMVDNINDWNKYLNGFVKQFDRELQANVEQTLKEWQESGFLEIVIDHALQTKIDDIDKKIGQLTLNVCDFDTIQEAIDYTQKKGGRLFFPQGTYKTNTIKIDPTLPIEIFGGGIDKTVVESEDTVFKIEQPGDGYQAKSVVIGGIGYGDKTVKVENTEKFREGHMVYIQSDEHMEETEVLSLKQYTTIVDYVGVDYLVLRDACPQTFDRGSKITIYGFNHARVSISDMTIQSCRGYDNPSCVSIRYGCGVNISKVRLIDKDMTRDRNPNFDGSDKLLHGIKVFRSADVKIYDSFFDFLVYGVIAHEGSVSTLIRDSRAFWCRHLNNFGLGSYLNRIENANASSCFAGFDSHDTTIDVTLVNCRTSGDVIQTLLRARRKVAVNCDFMSGLWSTTSKNVFDNISYDTKEGSSIGTWLYGCTISDQKNRRTVFDGYTLHIEGGKWEDITTHMRHNVEVLSVEGLYYIGDNIKSNSDIAVFYDAPMTTIRNCVAFGPDRGKPVDTVDTSNKIFLYCRETSSNVVLENVVIDGFRSGVHFATYGDFNLEFKGLEIKSCGYGFFVVNSYKTVIKRGIKLKLLNNFEDFNKNKFFIDSIGVVPKYTPIYRVSLTPTDNQDVGYIFIDTNNQLKLMLPGGDIKSFVLE